MNADAAEYCTVLKNSKKVKFGEAPIIASKVKINNFSNIVLLAIFSFSNANFHFSGLFISLNFQVPNYLLRVHSEKAILGMVILSEYRSKVLEPAAAKISRQ